MGDEMGLGKTVQVISFLAGLNYSKQLSRHGKLVLLSVIVSC
jgi:DNA excision repair protein ERCC-6